MNWTQQIASQDLSNSCADLPTSVGKAGATESVAFVAIIWGIAIIVAASSE
ncbi:MULTISPECIES: hypothetical protein [unclassified Sphingomonas]|uniref:hypothetical protein n=1 Tax=unclassified Sphingomonas TaxID=196159 RepID=UPI00226AD3AE|nr:MULTISPECIES: hypothetical protein [unclassified Sphingomonas]